MNLTTTHRVLVDRLKKSSAEETIVVEQYIAAVSAAAEQMLGRPVERVARTEYHHVRPATGRIALRAFPVTILTSIHNDPLREFSASTLIDPEWYFLDEETGVVSFDYALARGNKAVKAVYTGGMGADVDDLVANGFSDVVEAVTAQVIFLFSRRQTPHLTGHSDAAGNRSFTPAIEWLPWVKDALMAHRAVIHAS